MDPYSISRGLLFTSFVGLAIIGILFAIDVITNAWYFSIPAVFFVLSVISAIYFKWVLRYTPTGLAANVLFNLDLV